MLNIFNKFFKTHKPAEGIYHAEVLDVCIIHKGKSCPHVTIRYLMQNLDTGEFVPFTETICDNFNLIRCRDLHWFLEAHGIRYSALTDVIGAIFEVFVINDFVCGKEVPSVVYEDVITYPPDPFS